MNLWIRSQLGGCLIKTNDLKIMELDKEGFKALCDEDSDGFWSIVANDDPCVGKYATKERALEILDEIEGLLLLKKGLKLTADAVYSVENNLAIYEMPKE